MARIITFCRCDIDPLPMTLKNEFSLDEIQEKLTQCIMAYHAYISNTASKPYNKMYINIGIYCVTLLKFWKFINIYIYIYISMIWYHLSRLCNLPWHALVSPSFRQVHVSSNIDVASWCIQINCFKSCNIFGIKPPNILLWKHRMH